ncbi:hybrid sensor histidine kinase/response regulator [Pseudoduganella violaceinigra]|uniref:hybrid sensor histidine kinase/response regulator n=1 Tax=Pseudoduganella violaceinigra TaxID=246602 RepID=UPI0003FC1CED|nr:ATP-binding protein [Pseudoduganella violaceinigra]
MMATAAGSVRIKLILTALATTFVALVVTTVAMLVYDLKSFQQGWVDDLTTQAELVATASAPAISFNDPRAAQQNLGLLRVRPQIQAGAIYTANGALFASYAQTPGEHPVFPPSPGPLGHAIEGGHMVVTHPILDAGERVGTVYLSASYRLLDRVQSYALILLGVMLGSLLLAVLVAHRLQQAITRPLLAVTDVARAVMLRRDYSLQVSERAAGEIGTLVDAFNDMLAEIARRSNALQDANRTLEHEMTVRQGAERALLLADRRKDEFLATLAHELRNPLAPIRTGLDIMRINANDPVACERARSIMERQLKQMVRLVDDLLDVSRINTGKLTIRREQVMLQDVVNDALELSRPFIAAQGHTLHVQVPEPAVYLVGDATRLAQVLSNLLHNAAKYTARGGSISLEAQACAGQLELRVRDNGIGIPAALLNEIFEMFIQADSSLERSTAGLGVGLSLARKLVELHGGSIRAESGGEGQGSTFTVMLPVLADATVATAAAQALPSDARLHRILLADDNVDFVNGIGGLLRSMGHHVHIAHDGKQALVAAEGFAPEFAFLDIGLPQLNGYDLARALKRLPALKHTVLVAVTGWGQQKDRQQAFEAGFHHHLVKPVSIDQFQEILAQSGP